MLRVSANSHPNSVAGAIAALLRSEGKVDIQAIGPKAVNQAVKSLAIARSYVRLDSLDLQAQPAFAKLELAGSERTAIRFTVHSCPVTESAVTESAGADDDAQSHDKDDVQSYDGDNQRQAVKKEAVEENGDYHDNHDIVGSSDGGAATTGVANDQNYKGYGGDSVAQQSEKANVGEREHTPQTVF